MNCRIFHFLSPAGRGVKKSSPFAVSKPAMTYQPIVSLLSQMGLFGDVEFRTSGLPLFVLPGPPLSHTFQRLPELPALQLPAHDLLAHAQQAAIEF